MPPVANVLQAFGLRVACPLAVPGSREEDTLAPVDVTVTLEPSLATLESAWSGPGTDVVVANRWVDGRPLDYHRGPGGDTLLRWAQDGAWLIDAERASVRAHSPVDPPGAAWQRVLLDSVLGSVALGRGAEALHGGAVVVGGGAVALLGDTGAGKTSLVSALLARGHTLVTDDVVVLTEVGGKPAVWPAPPVLSLDTQRAPASVVAALGEAIAHLGDETWVHVTRIAQGAVPLRALVLLDRRADVDGAPALVPEPRPFERLFAHVLNSGAAADRELGRFRVVGDLVEAIPVMRLVAPLEGAEPAALAAVVEAL